MVPHRGQAIVGGRAESARWRTDLQVKLEKTTAQFERSARDGREVG